MVHPHVLSGMQEIPGKSCDISADSSGTLMILSEKVDYVTVAAKDS